MLNALSPRRRRMVLVSTALVLLVLLLAVAVIVRGRAGSPEPVPQDRPGPVLLVPGYGGNVDSLAPLATALRSAGRTVVIVDPVGDGRGDLRDQAEHLGEVADRARRDAAASSVDVVGYSAGGVVARLWVRDEGGRARARRVLTLGSPHHGTDQAQLGLDLAGGCPPACQQLAPGSDLLRRLNARDETPDGPQWVTIRSAADRVVTPTSSAALSGALNLVVQDICPRTATAHGDLPGDPVVRATLFSALGAAAPAAPTGVRCEVGR